MKKLNRKDIKRNAHIFLRGNYFMAIFTIFIFNIILNNSYTFTTKIITSCEKEKKEVRCIFYDKDTKKYSIKNATK